MKPVARLVASAFAALAVFLSVAAQAGGPVHGARAAAMGTAFVALADDASAFAYNPAGLAQLAGKSALYAGATLLTPATTYTDAAGRSQTTEFGIFAVPHAYLLPAAAADGWRFGFGAFSPFGVGGRQWNVDGMTRYASTESLTGTLVLNPVAAKALTPSVHVGVGIDYLLARSKSVARTNQALVGAGDGEMAMRGEGDGWGWNAGILVAPGAAWSFGAAYRSRIRVDLHGDLRLRDIAAPLQPLFGGGDFRTSITTAMTFPDIVSLGLVHRPSPRTTLSFDAEQVRWSSFGRSRLDLKDEVAAAGLVDSIGVMEWKNVWTLKAGVEHRLSARFALRAGYALVPSPVPGHTLTPAAPDSTLHHLSAGFGYAAADGTTIDVFYMAGFGRARDVNDAALSGRYDNATRYAGVSVGWSF